MLPFHNPMEPPLTLYREPLYPTHVVKPGLIPYYDVPAAEKQAPILPSQEVCILKRPNQKKNKE